LASVVAVPEGLEAVYGGGLVVVSDESLEVLGGFRTVVCG